MRVLIVTDWNRGQGGAEAYVCWLRDGLRKAGDEVRLMTSSAGSAGDGKAEYVSYGTENMAAQTFLQIVNPFAVSSVRRALREFKPQVVFVNMFAHHLSPAILHSFGHVPIVLSVSDYKCICPIGSKLRPDGSLCGTPAGWVCHEAGCVSLPHWIRDRPRYSLLKSGLTRAARVVSCSDWVHRELKLSGIESERVHLPIPQPRSPDAAATTGIHRGRTSRSGACDGRRGRPGWRYDLGSSTGRRECREVEPCPR